MENSTLSTPNQSYLYLTINKASSAKGRNDEIWLEALDWGTQAKILKLAELGAIKKESLKKRDSLSVTK